MTLRLPDRRGTLSALALALAASASHAQSLEFADDFSAESLRFTVDRRPEDRSVRTYDILDDRIVMTVSATSNDDQGRAELDAWGRSDSITARVSLDSVDLPVDRDADSRLRVAGHFYNEMADGGTNGRVGDVYVQLRLRARGDGSREASICVDRELEDGSEGVALFEDGDNCETFPDFVPELGTAYTLSVGVDRAAGTLTWSIDDQVRSVGLGQPVFLPARGRRSVQLTQEGTPGEAIASVYSVGIDGHAQDFTVEAPVIGPYRPFFDLQNRGRTLSVVDGRARLESASADGGDERLSMPVIGDSDRIEATLELSSESTLAGTGTDGEDAPAGISLGGTFYNDTAEGGFNENEGNVFSVIFVETADGQPELRYCMFRSNTTDFSDSNALLAEGEVSCPDFGIAADFDTAYPVSIELDRDAGLMRFRAGEIERTHTIATPIFSPESNDRFIRVQARARNGSTAVGYADDFRTSADAPLVANGGVTDDTDAEEPATQDMQDMDVGDTETPEDADADGTETPDDTDADGTETPDTTTDAEPATSSSGGSSGGGGCSIGGERSDGLTWLLGLLAAGAIVVRRRRTASL